MTINYNIVFTEDKTITSFLNLTEEEFYDKLWEWSYVDDLWYSIEDQNLSQDEIENAINMFIDEDMFHSYIDDDRNCFAFVVKDSKVEEYKIGDKLFSFVLDKVYKHYSL